MHGNERFHKLANTFSLGPEFFEVEKVDEVG